MTDETAALSGDPTGGLYKTHDYDPATRMFTPTHGTQVSTKPPIKFKVFTFPLNPIADAGAPFAQVLIPYPLRDDQKQRLLEFIKWL